jgi:hypothetical protein
VMGKFVGETFLGGLLIFFLGGWKGKRIYVSVYCQIFFLPINLCVYQFFLLLSNHPVLIEVNYSTGSRARTVTVFPSVTIPTSGVYPLSV